MSQKKVEEYKKEKANRKKNMKKQKMKNNLERTAITVVALALVGWLGFSVYDKHESGKERPVAEVNYDAVNDYLTQLSE